MWSKLLRYGRRQLHTIVSREIIKPSSPTPSRSKTYNLSLFDQMAIDSHTPIVAFYPNIDQSSRDKTLELKNSLSKTLTQYYPYAGKVKKSNPTYVDCNDEGVEYVEASNDSSLSDFLQRSEHEDFDPLFPHDIWFDEHIRGDNEGVTCPLAVQVNRFACGGVAIASTLFHKVGDARSMLNFFHHWATVTAKKDTSLINPQILHYRHTNSNMPGHISARTRVGCLTRTFLFPEQKINDLKAKVTAMTKESGQPIINPTRIEVLSWLIHNRIMSAVSKLNSGTVKATGVGYPTDMRGVFVEKMPGTTLGNLIGAIEFPTRDQSELAPHYTIGELRKGKAVFQSIPNFEAVTEIGAQISHETALENNKRLSEYYVHSSLCRIQMCGIDFGWGKPAKVTVGGTTKNFVIFMAAPDGSNGIEVSICLDKEEMKILQNDPEFLAFC